MIRVFAIAAALLLALPVVASEPSGLTADQLAALRDGRGMGLSLPAEMNNHPGPLHVLEYADALALTPEQRRATAALVAGMKAEAAALGETIIAREAELDALFAAGSPDDGELANRVAEVARLNGALRLVHLRTHVAARALLTPEQVAAYYRLRHHHGGPDGSPKG